MLQHVGDAPSILPIRTKRASPLLERPLYKNTGNQAIENQFCSLRASPMLPCTLILPAMKAVIGLSSPLTTATQSSALLKMVMSAFSGASPLPLAHVPSATFVQNLPPAVPEKSNWNIAFSPAALSGLNVVQILS